jgi:hypothetical protein
LGFLLLEDALAVSRIVVPSGVEQSTDSVSVNHASAPTSSERAVQMTRPPVPTAGVVHLHPAGAAIE